MSPVMASPDFSRLRLAAPVTLPATLPVILPLNVAVIVPASKLPLAARDTNVLPVLALVALLVIVYAVPSSALTAVALRPVPETVTVLAYCPVVSVPSATELAAMVVAKLRLPLPSNAADTPVTSPVKVIVLPVAHVVAVVALPTTLPV